MKNVEMPKMGDTMEEGKILQWLKKEGDPVKKGEMLAEVETDKVNIEIEAFASGTLRKILIPAGSSAPIGAAIALIGSPDEPLPGDPIGNRAEAAKTVGLPTPASPVTQPSTPALAFSDVLQPAPAGAASTNHQGRIFISPIARRIAQENQLDYATLRGTGPHGRIIKLDVEAALTRLKGEHDREWLREPGGIGHGRGEPGRIGHGRGEPGHYISPPTQPTTAPEPVPSTSEVLEIPLSSMRRTIARRLSQSMQSAPHFYVTSVIDTEKLAALRQQINAYAASDPSPIKVSFNDLIVKAVAKALVRMPQVNVSFAEDRLLQKKQVNIGVAVALEQGLIVPVLRNADQRGILDIARETRRLAEAAREGRLKPEDFSDGTFTISNLGMFDVESFTAVINPPESAILAVGSITPTPVVVNDQVVVRGRMKVTLSSDHRAIDGAIAARFLQHLKQLLEEPFGLML